MGVGGVRLQVVAIGVRGKSLCILWSPICATLFGRECV